MSSCMMRAMNLVALFRKINTKIGKPFAMFNKELTLPCNQNNFARNIFLKKVMCACMHETDMMAYIFLMKLRMWRA